MTNPINELLSIVNVVHTGDIIVLKNPQDGMAPVLIATEEARGRWDGEKAVYDLDVQELTGAAYFLRLGHAEFTIIPAEFAAATLLHAAKTFA